MDLQELIRALVASDPVYGPVRGPERIGKDGKPHPSFVRVCALCREVSGHNEENVRHQPSCPWIAARTADPLASLRAENDRLLDVLREIAFTGLTLPMEIPESDDRSHRNFYERQLKGCIGIAARALPAPKEHADE